jgi:hypothetical protein
MHHTSPARSIVWYLARTSTISESVWTIRGELWLWNLVFFVLIFVLSDSQSDYLFYNIFFRYTTVNLNAIITWSWAFICYYKKNSNKSFGWDLRNLALCHFKEDGKFLTGYIRSDMVLINSFIGRDWVF